MLPLRVKPGGKFILFSGGLRCHFECVSLSPRGGAGRDAATGRVRGRVSESPVPQTPGAMKCDALRWGKLLGVVAVL